MTPEETKFAPPEAQNAPPADTEESEERLRAVGKVTKGFKLSGVGEGRSAESSDDGKESFLSKFGEATKAKFEQLSDNVKDRVGELYDGAKSKIEDRAGLWYNSMMADRVSGQAEKLTVEKNSLDKEIEEAKRQDQALEKSIDTITKTLGPLKGDAQRAAEKEKNTILQSSVKAEGKRSKVEMSLITVEAKKQQFETKRDILVEKFVGQVNEKMTPLNEKMEDLEQQRELQSSKIEEQRAGLQHRQQRALEISKLLGEATFKFEKKAYQDEIKKLNKENDKAVKELEKAAKMQGKILDKISSVDKKRQPYLSKIDKLRGYKKTESGTSSPTLGARKETPNRMRLMDNDEIGEVTETVEAQSLDKWSDIWNKQFGDKLKLDSKDFKSFVIRSLGADAAVSDIDMDKFEVATRRYYSSIVKAKLKDKKYLEDTKYDNESELIADFRIFKAGLKA